MLIDLLRFVLALAMSVTCLLFIRAALHKLSEPGRFEGILMDYGLMPDAALQSLTRLIPAFELGAACLLLLPWTRIYGAALAGVLLSTYAFAMAISLLRGNRLVDCGCGDQPEPISWILVIRNSVLVSLMAGSALGYGALHSLPESLVIWAFASLLMALWASAEKAFSNLHRMQNTLALAQPATGGPV